MEIEAFARTVSARPLALTVAERGEVARPQSDRDRSGQAARAPAEPGTRRVERGGVVVALSDRARRLFAEGETNAGPRELTDEEQREVQALRRRDREVRAHETAHLAAAGSLARGGPRYEFERGPDGRRYAVGGEVSIDSSPVPGDPEATILKMQQVRRAALAPANPSPQDRRVAAQASQQEARARAEQGEQARRERAESEPESSESEEAVAPVPGSAPLRGARA